MLGLRLGKTKGRTRGEIPNREISRIGDLKIRTGITMPVARLNISRAIKEEEAITEEVETITMTMEDRPITTVEVEAEVITSRVEVITSKTEEITRIPGEITKEVDVAEVAITINISRKRIMVN